MASIYTAVPCPHCDCCATEDHHYKTDEKFIFCFRCGYNYKKTLIPCQQNDCLVFSEKELKGYGICRMKKLTGERSTKIFNRPLSNADILKHAYAFFEPAVNQEDSYFVIFKNNEFITLAGTPPKDFFIPFIEYQRKKAEIDQQLEIIIPL